MAFHMLPDHVCRQVSDIRKYECEYAARFLYGHKTDNEKNTNQPDIFIKAQAQEK